MALRVILSVFKHDLSMYFQHRTTYVTMARKNISQKKTIAASLWTDGSVGGNLTESQTDSDLSVDDSQTICQESSQTDKCHQNENTETNVLKFLVVGLGNPEIERTRHSVGMMFVDQLAKILRLKWKREAFKKAGGLTASGTFPNDIEIHLLKPRIPMNLNGTSVIKAVRLFNILPQNVYVIHDELDKSVGKFQLKEGGSAGGHNGVKSVMNCLKTDVMPRVLIGIDRPQDSREVISYVLEKFPYEDNMVIKGVINKAIAAMIQHMEAQHGVEINVRDSKPIIDSNPVEIPPWKKKSKFDDDRFRQNNKPRGRRYVEKYEYDYNDNSFPRNRVPRRDFDDYDSTFPRRPKHTSRNRRFIDQEDEEWTSKFEERYQSQRSPKQWSNNYDHSYSDDEFDDSQSRSNRNLRGYNSDSEFEYKNGRFNQGFKDSSVEEFDDQIKSERTPRSEAYRYERVRNYLKEE